MQENLAQLVLWDHCPSLSFSFSFAPQGYSLSALTDHCRVSPPLSIPGPSHPAAHCPAGCWPKEGEMPKGLSAAGGVGSSRAHSPLSPPIYRDITSLLGQNLCLGAQAQIRRLALDPTAVWGAAGVGEQITPHPPRSDISSAAGVCSPTERVISA